MEEAKYAKMVEHLQQYVPPLEKLIAQLKDPKRKNRELQLNKLEGLHSMITDKRKKLKLETLQKCEDVILKILQKVTPNLSKPLQLKTASEQRSSTCNMIKFVCKDPPEEKLGMFVGQPIDDGTVRLQAARARLNEITTTPASPSPTRDLPRNLSPSPSARNSMKGSIEKPDIYRLAGESLANKQNTLDIVSPRIDISKPPLSKEDLLLLTEPEKESYLTDSPNLSELEDLRAAIQQELKHTAKTKSDHAKPQSKKESTIPDLNKSKGKESQVDQNIKKIDTASKVPIFKLASPPPQPVPPPLIKPKPSPRIETILKDPISKFGDFLSSIDEKILKDDKKKDRKSVEDIKGKPFDKKCDKNEVQPVESKKKNVEVIKSQVENSAKTLPQSPPVYKRLADKYNPKPRKPSTELSDPRCGQDIGKSGTSPAHIESICKKPNLESKSEKPSLGISVLPQPGKPNLMGNQYIPNPDGRLLSKPSHFSSVINQNSVASSPQNRQCSPLQTNHYGMPQQNQFPMYLPNTLPNVPNILPSQNMMPCQNMLPAQNMMPAQNIMPSHNMMASPNMIPSHGMIPPHNMMAGPHNVAHHNGNTYMNTYIVQNNISSNLSHSHYNHPISLSQNAYHNQVPSKAFSPYQSSEVPNTTPYSGYQQNNYRINSDPRKASRDRAIEAGMIRHENRVKVDSRPTQAIISKDPRMRRLTPENTRRNSTDTFQNKYDTLYSNIDKDSEKFVSPLDRLYSSGDSLQKTGKGYGTQKFRIPKRNVIQHAKPELSKNDDTHNNQEESDDEVILKERSSCRVIRSESLSPPPAPVINASNDDISESDAELESHTSNKNESTERSKSNKVKISNQKTIEKNKSSLMIQGNERSDRNKVSHRESPRKKSVGKISSNTQDTRTGKDVSVKYSHKEEPKSTVKDDTHDATKKRTNNKCNETVSPLEEPKKIQDSKEERRSKDIPKKETYKNDTDSESSTTESEIQTDIKVSSLKDTKKNDDKIENSISVEEPSACKVDEVSIDIEVTQSKDDENKSSKQDENNEPVVMKENAVLNTNLQESSNAQSSTSVCTEKEQNAIVTPISIDTQAGPSTAPSASDNETSDLFTAFLTLMQKTLNNKESLDAFISSLKTTPLDQQSNKLKGIQQIGESDLEDEQVKKSTNTKSNVKSIELESTKTASNTLDETSTDKEIDKPPAATLKKKVKRKRRKFLLLKKGKRMVTRLSATNSSSSLEQNELVPKSVKENAKTHKRVSPQLKSKKRFKFRSELDRLHEDIKEMFMRDSILSATGKRMCRMPKPDEQKQSIETESSSTTESPKRRARSTNPKVIIEKTDITNLVPPNTQSNKESTDTDSEHTVKLMKRILRHKSKLDSTTTSESSLTSPARVFPKRKIKNKPNYYEDPNDLSVPKRPGASEQPEPSKAVITPVNTENPKPDSKVPTQETPITQPLKVRKKPGPKPKPKLITQIGTPQVTIKKRLVKKKKANWSLGIIKKKKRYTPPDSPLPDPVSDTKGQVERTPTPSLPSVTMPDDGILVLPDVSYYFDPQDKSPCKLCAYKGKFIVQHYKSHHPDSEVFISRIAPDESKRAIKESLDKSYSKLVIPLEEQLQLKQKFTYQCRFCHTFFKNETSETFFDHLTSHTGEYRFACKFCSFKTSNSKSLRSHYYTAHTANCEQAGAITPSYEAPPSYHIVFGYCCSECYYIQLDQTAIKTHIKVYHLGENNTIYKISMSMIVKQPEPLVPTIDKSITVENKILKNTDDKNVNVVEAEIVPASNEIIRKKRGPKKKPIITNVQEAPEDCTTTDVDMPPETITSLEVVEPPESGLDTPISNNIKDTLVNDTEDEPEEVSIIQPKKCSFDVLDKIKYRLGDDDEGKIHKHEGNIKDLKMFEICSVKTENVVTSTNEDCQGKLTIDDPSIPLITIKKEECAIQVGPLRATKSSDNTLFSCHIQSCTFSTSIIGDFIAHCTHSHHGSQWDRFCSMCDAKLEHYGVEAADACNHLLKVHLDIAVDETCLESEAQMVENLIEDSSDPSMPFKILSVHTEEQMGQIQECENFSFCMTDVRTISPDEYDNLHPATSTSINDTSGTFRISPLKPVSTEPLRAVLGSPAPPALVPVCKTSPLILQNTSPKSQSTPPPKHSKKIILRDVPLSSDELLKDRKSVTAMAELLKEEKLSQLYKCPEYDCTFSTDLKRMFDVHIKQQHRDIARDQLIPCLCCNYKTEFSNVAIHYDVRHSKCTYCCAYCFYRAVNQPYVEMHQDLMHKGLERRVIRVASNQDALTSQANITLLPVAHVVPPFICSCKKKFLTGNDIIKHARAEHGGLFECGYCFSKLSHLEGVTLHMQNHNVYTYQCRYCPFGSNSTDDVYKHLSQMHFAYVSQIISRRVIDVNPTTILDYEDRKSFEHLKIIDSDYSAYLTLSALIDRRLQNINKVQKLPPLKALSESQKDLMQLKGTTALLKPTSATESVWPVKKPASQVAIVAPQVNQSNKIDTSETANASNKQTQMQKESPVSIIDTTDKNEVTLKNNPDNSLNEILDLTLSDSGETQLSDISVDESQSSTKKTGLSGRDLFKCGSCSDAFDVPRELRVHILKCPELNNTKLLKPHKCAHCTKPFKNVNNLLEHLRLHGTNRFACSLCGFKAQHQLYIRQHMKSKHKVTSVTLMPVDGHKRDFDCDEFVIKPKIHRQKSVDSLTKDVTSTSQDDNKPEKLMYSPHEASSLPFRPIFLRDLGCSACGFTSKVKANLLRHLNLHLQSETSFVPTSAPINPVPCLEKNEKMFDKMTNLSHSGYNSNSSRMSGKTEKKEIPHTEVSKEEQEKLPLYVPSTKRNVCGATGCDYLCLDDGMFKRHLAALHGTELFYKCKHCEAFLSSGDNLINVDMIINHQKLHGLHLYKCKYCSYLCNVKHKIESHITKEHPNSESQVVVIREMLDEPQLPVNFERDIEWEETKESKPWRCGMCKSRFVLKEEIVAHVLNKHGIEDSQYKCALCKYKSNTMSAFPVHFEAEHSGRTVDVIDVYYKIENNTMFDTTPIWNLSRNSNTIRGIPLDGSKPLKKSPIKIAMSDNIGEAIESVASGTSTSVPKIKTLKDKKSDNNIVIVDDKPSMIKERRKSIPVSKKLKALQEKVAVDEPKLPDKESEIIEIDDDSPDMDKNLAIASFAGTTTLKEIEEMDLKILIDANLSGKYGQFGQPLNMKYLCPRCRIFKTSVKSDITNHLYKELGYYKFICTICRLYGVTYKFLQNHSKTKHSHRPESIIPLTPDPAIEDWVEKVIAVQTRIMNGNKPMPPPVSSSSPDAKATTPVPPVIPEAAAVVEEPSSTTSSEAEVKDRKPQLQSCPHCSYTCKHLSDLRKHERRHWLQKPLKCGHCDLEGVTNHEIVTHSKRIHPNLEPSIVAVPTPSSPTIQPIVRKRKRASTKSASDESNSSLNISLNESDSVTEEDKLVYVCAYCRKRTFARDDAENHCKSLHPYKAIKFREILSSQLPKKLSVNYKCFYCKFIGTFEIIKQHFIMEHPTQNLSFFRYQCPYCSEYFRKLEKIKAHCKKLHGDDNPSQLDIKLNTETEPKITKVFNCKDCTMQYDSEKDLSEHIKNVHGSTSSVVEKTLCDITKSQPNTAVDDKKQFKCPECEHTSNNFVSINDHLRGHTKPVHCIYCSSSFIYPSYCKSHCIKEHPGLPPKSMINERAQKKLKLLKKNLLVLKDGEYVPAPTAKACKRTKSPTTIAKKLKVEVVQKTTARKSTTQLLTKETARKSTTQIIPTIELDDDDEMEDEGFLFYNGETTLDNSEDVKNISLADKTVGAVPASNSDMSAKQL